MAGLSSAKGQNLSSCLHIRAKHSLCNGDTMEKAELAKQIETTSRLTGQFKLRSGKTSSFYIDKYRFESNPALLSAIVDELQKLLPTSFGKLAGLELGGIPLATVLSLRTGKPCSYVRKKAKTYGTCNLVEGGFKPGETVVVVEDAITTAGQVCASVEQMRELGLMVKHVICVIDREQGGEENLKKIGCSLASVFTLNEVRQGGNSKISSAQPFTYPTSLHHMR